MLNDLQKELIKGLSEYLNMSTFSELKEIITKVKEIDENDDDFEIDGLWYQSGSRGVRIISSDSIERIWEDELEELIKDCYNLSEIPSFIEIDWEATVNNCKQDGEGHHFSSWDGSQHETGNFYLFKN